MASSSRSRRALYRQYGLVAGLQGPCAGRVSPTAGVAATHRGRRSRPVRRNRGCRGAAEALDSRCRARIRSPRQSSRAASRARTRSPGAFPAPQSGQTQDDTAVNSSSRSNRARYTTPFASVELGLDPAATGPLQFARRHDLAADPGHGQPPSQPEPGQTGLISHRHRPAPARPTRTRCADATESVSPDEARPSHHRSPPRQPTWPTHPAQHPHTR